jgi:aminopeptidase-like protein
VLRRSGRPHRLIDYHPFGYDERQYNSPGFRLPVGSLMRGRHGEFPEYHTSADNLDFVSAQRLGEAYEVVLATLEVLDERRVFRNLCPWGEPQLGRRGLYRALGGGDVSGLELALLWVLSLSDGGHSLLDIAERAKLDLATVELAAGLLVEHGLLAEET